MCVSCIRCHQRREYYNNFFFLFFLQGMSFTAVNHLGDAAEDTTETSLKTFAIRTREAASTNELYSTIQRAIDDM